MKRYILPLTLCTLAGISVAQFPAPNEVDTRVSPVYPPNRSAYMFRTTPPNYDPFQFNWSTGRWDYVPFPYDSWSGGTSGGAPYQLNAATGRWDYVPQVNQVQVRTTPEPTQQPAPAAISSNPLDRSVNNSTYGPGKVRDDDEELWVAPATQPAPEAPPKVVTFTGRLLNIRAVNIVGNPRPHLLLRLRTSGGANATVNVGERLDLPGGDFKLPSDAAVTVTGKLGAIDSSPVIFADTLTIGSKTLNIARPRLGSGLPSK